MRKGIKIPTMSTPGVVHYHGTSRNPIKIQRRIVPEKEVSKWIYNQQQKECIGGDYIYLYKAGDTKIVTKPDGSQELKELRKPLGNLIILGSILKGCIYVSTDKENYAIIKSYVDKGWKAGMIALSNCKVIDYNGEKCYSCCNIDILAYELVSPSEDVIVSP